MSREKMQFNNISLSINTVVWHVVGLSAHVKHQVTDIACASAFYSITCDESTDATDTAQLLIFLQGVGDDFCIMEKLLNLRSLKSTTMGKDIFKAVTDAIDKMRHKWDKLCGVKMAGAPAMIVEGKRLAYGFRQGE